MVIKIQKKNNRLWEPEMQDSQDFKENLQKELKYSSTYMMSGLQKTSFRIVNMH